MKKSKDKIDEFVAQAKEIASDFKDKAIELYDKAIQALKGGSK